MHRKARKGKWNGKNRKEKTVHKGKVTKGKVRKEGKSSVGKKVIGKKRKEEQGWKVKGREEEKKKGEIKR